MALRARQVRRIVVYLVVFVLIVSVIGLGRLKVHNINKANFVQIGKGIVLAKVASEDAQWVDDLALAQNWTSYIYSTSTPPEPGYLIPPSTRGHEVVSYLSFIVNHYSRLPLYTVFIHAKPAQWHNDVMGENTLPILENIRFDSIDRLGYMNLRCTLDPGCPISVNPHEPTETDIANDDVRAHFADIYSELFNVEKAEVPAHLGNVCCGQFAVSKERILQRPRKDYQRMLNWAINSKQTDSFGVGWVFEKVWHVVFGMPAVHCPPYEQCRCDLLGWCGPHPQGPSIAT